MKLSNLFLNKTYLLPYSTFCSENQIELITNILNSLENPIFAQEFKFISSNDDYDTYKFNDENYSYCIKISLDSNCRAINHESLYLKKINKLICANYIADGKIKIGDEIRYLITTYENADSINLIGKSCIISNFDNFCYSYNFINDSKKIDHKYEDIIKITLKDLDIESNFTEDALNSLKSYTNYNIIENIIKELNSNIEKYLNKIQNQQTYPCHGNLNLNNILFKNNVFKFINFDYCNSSHHFVDFCEIVLELGLDEETEILFLNKFCKALSIDLNTENINLYKKYYELILNKKALTLLVMYLKEVYLYSSLRDNRIIQIANIFSQGYDRFLKIKVFHENRDFILKTITEPILNQKA